MDISFTGFGNTSILQTKLEEKILSEMDAKIGQLDAKLMTAFGEMEGRLMNAIKEQDVSIQKSSDDVKVYVGMTVTGMATTIKNLLKEQSARFMLASASNNHLRKVSLLPRIETPDSQSHDDDELAAAGNSALDDDTNVSNAAATAAVGLNPLEKISSVELMEKFNTHIIKKDIADIYVSTYIY